MLENKISSNVTTDNRPILIWQLANRGFGSEICLLVFAILYSLENDMQFALCSRYSNITYRFGWRDYFLPFCREIEHPLLRIQLLFMKNFVAYSLVSMQKILLSLSMKGRRFYLTRDVFPAIWNHDFMAKYFSIPSHDIQGDVYVVSKTILNSIWKFNRSTQIAITALRADVMPGNTPYCTLYIRRGDKIREAPNTRTEVYVKKMQEINADIKTCFVITDDFSVVVELRRLYPDWNIFTLCDEWEKGYQNKTFNALTPELRKQQIMKWLTSLTIAQEGLFFVGTYSSNLSRLVTLLMGKERTYGVDFDTIPWVF